MINATSHLFIPGVGTCICITLSGHTQQWHTLGECLRSVEGIVMAVDLIFGKLKV